MQSDYGVALTVLRLTLQHTVYTAQNNVCSFYSLIEIVNRPPTVSSSLGCKKKNMQKQMGSSSVTIFICKPNRLVEGVWFSMQLLGLSN